MKLLDSLLHAYAHAYADVMSCEVVPYALCLMPDCLTLTLALYNQLLMPGCLMPGHRDRDFYFTWIQ